MRPGHRLPDPSLTERRHILSNATKAQIIAAINAGIGLLVAFGVTVSDGQTAAIIAGTNALLSIAVTLTYKGSAKRIPDA